MERIIVESADSLSHSDDAFLDQIEAVEKSAWPQELIANREKFISRLKIFPQGFITVEINGQIKGVTTSQIIDYDPSSTNTWNELTGNGYIKNSHNPEGNAIYVVSVAVAKDTQGLGLGGRLVDAQKELARKLDKKFLLLGARIPGYDSYCKVHGEISVEKYLELRNDKGEPFDPEIRFYARKGLEISKIVRDFEPDSESRDYGVVMRWENS